ncbi:iron (metal) dependent repressor, DtxR family [Proteiniborus ethanoligenes]|uniref:Manganese transport regulator n=2 Tax=Proteiniborus ethanoligenes TaxID=415015 RepID=A0A1H3S8R6_9FIRM|nr:iron (metal) dependent repressor, DtxR family [Proteiniborus ethanoligenes]
MTGSKEDYLKVIYELGGHSKKISNKKIVEALNISPPSVSEMVKKLLDEGYIEYEAYHGVKLTELGIREAIKIKRRHLLWEVFLSEYLGYSWDEVHDEAEKLEHVTSEELEKHLEIFLNYPKFCPHGTPILKNNTSSTNYRTLDLLSIGEKTQIHRLLDEKELLQYVSELGLGIGDCITVIHVAPYNGPITLRKGKTNIIIGLEAAKKIYVD